MNNYTIKEQINCLINIMNKYIISVKFDFPYNPLSKHGVLWIEVKDKDSEIVILQILINIHAQKHEDVIYYVINKILLTYDKLEHLVENKIHLKNIVISIINKPNENTIERYKLKETNILFKKYMDKLLKHTSNEDNKMNDIWNTKEPTENKDYLVQLEDKTITIALYNKSDKNWCCSVGLRSSNRMIEQNVEYWMELPKSQSNIKLKLNGNKLITLYNTLINYNNTISMEMSEKHKATILNFSMFDIHDKETTTNIEIQHESNLNNEIVITIISKIIFIYNRMCLTTNTEITDDKVTSKVLHYKEINGLFKKYKEELLKRS